jgi:hypothetical protein
MASSDPMSIGFAAAGRAGGGAPPAGFAFPSTTRPVGAAASRTSSGFATYMESQLQQESFKFLKGDIRQSSKGYEK